ncbi:MAG: TGS domain-containing protein [Gemmatimonadetes bacterium]|nr:TGS domain-containing protein [Gemmatimonadota bacterium]NNM06187.1 TGS domain-containing protein [Gemmatimonadota bacterium]
MPANLTPIYREAEAKFKAAVTREEKIAALEEMLRVIPKHKGTEHLQADLRSRLSKLRQEPKKKGVAKGISHKIPKEGAGQVALVGAPNSGKSSLVAQFTHAKPDVAAYPMTTLKATPGMMPYEDVGFQLVDLPPLCHEHVEPWVYDLTRAADLVWLVVSIRAPLQGLELVEELLAGKAIGLYPAGTDAPEAPRPGWTYKKTLLVITGMDLPGAQGDLEALEELIELPWPRVTVSTTTDDSLEALGRATFEALDIMRVYSKEPRKDPDLTRPFTLTRGSTVEDLARAIHKEIAEEIRFARVWGPSAFDGQSVHEHHVLEEGDVVELHR